MLAKLNERYLEEKQISIARQKIILSSASDRIVPVLGYIGMGKTFLMH